MLIEFYLGIGQRPFLSFDQTKINFEFLKIDANGFDEIRPKCNCRKCKNSNKTMVYISPQLVKSKHLNYLSTYPNHVKNQVQLVVLRGELTGCLSVSTIDKAIKKANENMLGKIFGKTISYSADTIMYEPCQKKINELTQNFQLERFKKNKSKSIKNCISWVRPKITL